MRRFLPFLLFLLIVAASVRADFFFTVVYFLFGVYLLSRFWTQRAAGQLRVERRFTPRAFFGEQVTVHLTAANTGLLPITWVELHESLPVQLIAPPAYERVVSLGPREQRNFDYTLYCYQRGYYRIGPLRAQTGDLLGLIRQGQQQLSIEHLIVYPRIVPLEQLGLPTHSPLVALPARSPLFEDPARLMGVRDYQPGDSLRRIHWTATASTGRILVKRYQPAIARETVVCLDLDEASYDQRQRVAAAELAITVAASVANHAIVRERQPVGLITAALDPLVDRQTQFYLPPRQERAHLIGLLEVLARVQLTSAGSFAGLVRQHSARLAWGSTLLLITGRESPDLFDALAHLRRAGFAVALILVQAPYPSEALQRRAALLHVPVHRVWTQRELELWQ